MKKIVLFLMVLVSFPSFSQSVNEYQYVVVSSKFDFLKQKDQFQLNTTTKLLLQKYGFKSYLDTEELPKEVADSRCRALYATVVKDNAFLVTKLKVVLKDCQDKVLFETEYGTSRLKDFGPAYNEAIRTAGKSFDKLNYKYNGGTQEDVEIVTAPAVSEPVQTAVVPKNDSILEAVAEPLFAKPFGENGFQLLTNNTDVPRYVMTIYRTSSPDCFITGNKTTITGVLLKKSGKWFFEYYENNALVSKPMVVVNLN